MSNHVQLGVKIKATGELKLNDSPGNHPRGSITQLPNLLWIEQFRVTHM